MKQGDFMFDGALEKVSEAITRMSKTLSMFEKEYTDLRVKGTEELMALLDSSDSKIKSRKEDLEKVFVDYKDKFKELIDDYKKQLSELTVDSVALFSQETKNRFEFLYTQYEEEAKKRALQTFDQDMIALFGKYGDQIAPLMFKALMRYIFHIGKKS
jgi:uncharacterized membrane-anchored protein YhcB (DUF1043 family)